MKKRSFLTQLITHCKKQVKVYLLMKSSYKEDQDTVIFYMAVWSEVAWEADFFEKNCFRKMSKVKNHNVGNEWGRNSRFWIFEKGNRHRIARSSDLDYSRAPKTRFLNYVLWIYDFPGSGDRKYRVFPYNMPCLGSPAGVM